MKKRALALVFPLLFFPAFVFSEESLADEASESANKNAFVFFSDEVPRYKDFAVGAFFTNQYAVGGWSDFAVANLGGGLDVEYTVPAFLPYNLDVGATIHIDASHTFPKSDTTLKSHGELRLYTAAFVRIPFTFFGQTFAFQPEFGYGVSFNNCVGQKGSHANGWYVDQTIVLAPALRYMAPQDFLSMVEFEFSPYFTFGPEQSSEAVNFLGFRLGVVWHLQNFIKTRKARTNTLSALTTRSNESKADKELSKKLRQELSTLLKYPELFLGVDPEALTDFTPDGDGVHDTITFRPATSYMSQEPEEWSLTIFDPQGNVFKTWSGKGLPPQEIVWDGFGDDGSLAFSRENYRASLAVKLCERDRQLLGRDSLEAVVEGSVIIENGIILKKTGENEWRIELTSISFDPDKATFENLSNLELALFLQSLDEIAQKLLTVSDTLVRIEGYANNTSGTEEENINDLIPLSQMRAEKIEEMLIERGIEKEKITAVGMGGANPKAALNDRANWWKNRRIEIVLTKEEADNEN